MPHADPLRTAIEAFGRLADATPTEAGFLAAGCRIMRELVATDGWLPAALATPGATYRQYLLHADPAGRFSLVSFVWAPGQHTPIHDHLVPGIIGQLRGSEAATRYHPGEPSTPPVAGERAVLRPGEVATVSTGTDIHRVENLLPDAVSISIHAYAGDIGSIKRHRWDAETGERHSFMSGYSTPPAPAHSIDTGA
jgi:predicted metal-dependent enzyme (double-stranded beta helix superfamily)